MSVVDLSALPTPEAVSDLSFSSIREQWVSTLESIDTDLFASLVPGDPAYELIQIGATRELYTKARVNDATRQRFMALAYGAGLDELGRVLEVERIADETDDDYRLRVHAAERSKGTGSEARYERAAKAASQYILHVHAARVGSSQLAIYWTPTFDSDIGQRIAAGFAIQALLAGADPEGFEVRMLTDEITEVTQASESLYDLTAHLHIAPGPDPSEVVARATEAASTLCNEVLRGGGVPVPLSELHAALSVVGVEKVDISSPVTDLAAFAAQYHELDALTITHETAAWLL